MSLSEYTALIVQTDFDSAEEPTVQVLGTGWETTNSMVGLG